ncbi:MAG: RHS repeat-associated core domain-containing protein, partial [Chloroflexaceae bacterium]
DGFRQATSDPITVREVFFNLEFSPTESYINDPTLSLTIEAVDDAGQPVTGYRGSVNLNPSVPMHGLPQSTLNTPDYVFTPEDAGRHIFPDLAFTEEGDHNVTMVDRGNNARQSTSNSVSTSIPPAPTPVPAQPQPSIVTIPGNLPGLLPQPIPLGWGMPYQATSPYEGSNSWRGYPEYAVPATPGAMYIVSGSVLRGAGEWWATHFYACPYLGWENPLTDQRERGGGIGYLPYEDPTFMQIGLKGCSGWSGYPWASVAYFGPALSDPAPLAPIATQGTHINIHAAGNGGGSFSFVAAPADGIGECDALDNPISVGDPVDTRSGTFYLNERDLGIETGCDEVDLFFERAYSRLNAQGGALGPGWAHNYEQRIIPSGDYVLVQRPRGSFQIFKDVGGDVYAGTAGAQQTLMKRDGGGWILVHRDRRADLFDTDGRLEAQQDANGNMLWMTYETYDYSGLTGTRLARVDAPGGRYLWFGYDYYRPTRLVLVGDNSGRTVHFGYEDTTRYDFVNRGRLVSVTDPLGQTETYSYTADIWLLERKTDALGNTVFSNTYDAGGRVIRQINNTGADLSFTYDIITDTAAIAQRVGSDEAAELSALFITSVTDQQGAQTEYVYGSDGLLRSMRDPLGAVTRYRGYTASRQATEIEDALGHVTGMQYNSLGLPVTITDALSQSVTLAYDDWGNVTTITDAAGQSYTLTYAGPNLTRIEDPAGRSLELGYSDQAGWQQLLSSITQPGGATTTLTYDAAGDLTAITDALGRETRLTYDNLGRPIEMIEPNGVTTKLVFDAADRVERMTQVAAGSALPDRTMIFEYDAVGNLISATDPLSQTTNYAYDAAGRVVTETLANGDIITFTHEVQYNTHSTISSITPPDRPSHNFEYTLVGLLERYLPPEVGSGTTDTTFTHDLIGQLTELTDPDDALVTLDYDAVGRLSSITAPHGTTQLTYDPVTQQLQTVTAPDGGTVTATYDPTNGWPTTTTWTGEITGQISQTSTLAGQVAAIQVNQEPALHRSYALDGAVVQAGALALDYDPATGRLTGSDLGAVTDTWAYTSFSEPARYTAVTSATTLLDTQITRDSLGRIASTTETIGGVTTTFSYTYDQRGQLTTVQQDGSVVATYTYDANGNRLSVTDTQGTVTASYDAQDRVLQAGATSATYTAAGALRQQTTGADTTTYTYDVFGNLTAVTLPDSTAISYQVDGLNRRIGKRVNGTLVQGWLYQDDLRPIAELDGQGQVVSQFVYASRINVPDYILKQGRTYRVIADQRGSPRLVVDGVIVQRMDYDVWGQVLVDTNPGFQPFGFAGGLYDPDTGLTRFGARDYDAATGRWTSKDPLGFNAGDTNLYRYVGNDPVNWIDPTGHIPAFVAGALVGALSAAVLDIGLQLLLNRWQWECINWGQVGWSMAIGGLLGGTAAQARRWYRVGKEFSIGRNFRIAPFGNRTGHRFGEYPHYHRVRRFGPKFPGKRFTPRPGQGMDRHRPWEPDPRDKSLLDRF